MKTNYKRMVRSMFQKEKGRRRRKLKEEWSLYILKCEDGSFYTGITKDLENRLEMHRTGKASRYTRTRRPVKLIYEKACGNRTQALVRECEVKALPRVKKEELISRG